MQRKWWILIAVSLAFFFVTATTFTSLGVVLYTMVAELHWSQSAAGFSFSLLGLCCGLSSPLPAWTMRRWGPRWTMLAGAIVLALGFALAALSHAMLVFFTATCLMGVGFTLLAPVPAIHLITAWFPTSSSRMLGYYFMSGAFGGVVGPLLINFLIQWTGSWRLHWALMAGATLVLGAFCTLVVSNAKSPRHVPVRLGASVPPPAGLTATDAGWTARQATRTYQFGLIALAMVIIQTGVTTVHSVLVTHMVHLGATQTDGSIAMSLVGLCGTLTKGVAGELGERLIHPRQLLLSGIGLQVLAFLGFGLSHSVLTAYLFAALFGVGWGCSWLSAHLTLLRYFGSAAATGVVAAATTLTTIAVIGPTAAGMIADHTGGFTLIFLALAGLYGLIFLSTSMMRAPARRAAPTQSLQEEDVSTEALRLQA